MNRKKSLTLIILLLAVITSHMYSFDFVNVPSWLDEKYPVTESYDDFSKNYKFYKAGCYAIGNGYVFSAIGNSYPINVMHDTCGPDYTVPWFSEEYMEFSINGQVIDFPSQSIRWVKGAGIVVSKLAGSGLEVTTIDFAPPEIKALLRFVIVKNLSNRNIDKVKVTFRYSELIQKQFTTSTDKDNSLFVKQKNIETKFYKIGLVNNSLSPEKNKNCFSLEFNLNPGSEIRDLRYIAIDKSEAEVRNTEKTVKSQDALLLLESTKKTWDLWMAQTTHVETGDPRVDYILEANKLILKSQQCYSGMFSPMHTYTYTWVRDNSGPIRYLLSLGKFEDVKKILESYYNAASNGMFIQTSMPADFAVSLKEKEAEVNWDNYEVLGEEIPSLLLLQFMWYEDYTKDEAFVKDKFKFLKRLLDGQEIDQNGLMKFSNDETYMYTLQVRTFASSGSNNYFIGKDAYSIDSAYLFIAASEKLALLGDKLNLKEDAENIRKREEMVRAALDKYYWMEKEGYYAPALSIFHEKYNMPQANIALNPLWCGVPDTSDLKIANSTKKQINLLLKDNDLMKNNPSIDVFSGLVPGMLLYDSVKMEDPNIKRYLNGLLKCASPSGEFCELYDGDGYCQIVKRTSYCSGRIRPWEGGVCADALMYYLTGLEDNGDGITLKPVVLSKGPLIIQNLKFKDYTLDITVKDEPAEDPLTMKKSAIILNHGNLPVKILFKSGIQRAQMISGPIDDTTKEEVEFSKVILPNESVSEEVIYKAQDVPVKRTSVKYKKPWVPYPKSDIVYFTVTDKDIYYTLARNKKVIPFDMQYCFTGDDIYEAIYDEKNKTIKTKIVIFGPGAFASGVLTWKNYAFWNSWEMQNAFKKYLLAGGIVIIMSEPQGNEGYEESPGWLTKLLNKGEWASHWRQGDMAVSDDFTETALKNTKTDSFEYSDLNQSKDKNAVIYQKIDSNTCGISPKSASGEKYTGFCEFKMKTQKKLEHTVTIKAASSIPSNDLNLETKTLSGFISIPLFKKQVVDNFIEISFIIPSQYINSDSITVRIGSLRPKEKIIFKSVEIYKMQITGKNSLSEVLGFTPADLSGKAWGSLTYKNMKAPVRLAKYDKYGVVVIKNVESGIVLRTQLSYYKMRNVIQNLLDPEAKQKVVKYLQNAGEKK